MGFWGTLGHAALRYGPYVAAPFTGGASLALVPYTTGADAAWSGIEASRARNNQGLGPSANFNPTASPGTNRMGITSYGVGAQTPYYGADPTGMNPNTGGAMPFEGMRNGGGRGSAFYDDTTMRGLGPRSNPMSQINQDNPNLALTFGQGRLDAIRNQPFRSGYQINTQNSGDPTATNVSYTPRISYYGRGYY